MGGYLGPNGKFVAVDVAIRFWSKVHKTEGCWLWIGACWGSGYGCIFYDGRVQPAHRWSYEQVKGAVPEGTEIDHLCRTRRCVRPDHLEAVSHQTNSLRGDCGENQRQKTHCPQSHPYNGYNLIIAKRGRVCRVCTYAAGQRWREQHREAYNVKQREYGARYRARKAGR